MVAIRDKKGRLVKGHPFLKSQNGIKNGAKKTLKGKVRDALQIAEDAMPQIILGMIARANGGEDCPAAVRQAASEYLCDRIYGKPNLPLTGANGEPIKVEHDVKNKLISELTRLAVAGQAGAGDTRSQQ